MANKPDEPESLEWGTLEELLLACAIHRHGLDSWDFVAKEVQKRSSAASHSFTSHNCKQKYYDLKHRFASQTDLVGGAAAEDGAGDTIPWLDELRRRRIAELKLDLERFDLSIGSLQLKLRRLSEEREKCWTENERKSSDLQKRENGDDRDEEEGEKPPLLDAEDLAPAVESDRENHSVNASISSEQRGDNSAENRDESAGRKNPADSPADSEDKTANPACEDSINGSSETSAVVEGPAGSVKAEPVCFSPELVESNAESKRGEEEEELEKMKSEVRTSASVSGKKGRCESVDVNKSGAEAENQSAADNCASVKPQPLADLLDVIRRHKCGSVFERRLDSQESSKYKNMIRQHVDLATIRKRLEEGVYSECHKKFYRDLLLLATNATLFFPESAPEHNSAIDLRRLVSTTMPSKAKVKTSFIDSPLLLTSPVIACRKRSLVVLKKPPSGEKKRDQIDEKPEGNISQAEKPSWLTTVTKKRSREQSSLVSRTEENAEVKNKKNDDIHNNHNHNVDMSGGGKKKKSVRNFLNRIQGSSTDSLNGRGSSSGSGSKSEEKVKDSGKSSCKGSLPVNAKGKGKQKEGSNGEDSQRNNGRPPKRAAAVAGMGKRRGDGGGDKGEGGLPKKRSRK